MQYTYQDVWKILRKIFFSCKTEMVTIKTFLFIFNKEVISRLQTDGLYDE